MSLRARDDIHEIHVVVHVVVDAFQQRSRVATGLECAVVLAKSVLAQLLAHGLVLVPQLASLVESAALHQLVRANLCQAQQLARIRAERRNRLLQPRHTGIRQRTIRSAVAHAGISTTVLLGVLCLQLLVGPLRCLVGGLHVGFNGSRIISGLLRLFKHQIVLADALAALDTLSGAAGHMPKSLKQVHATSR